MQHIITAQNTVPDGTRQGFREPGKSQPELADADSRRTRDYAVRAASLSLLPNQEHADCDDVVQANFQPRRKPDGVARPPLVGLRLWDDDLLAGYL